MCEEVLFSPRSRTQDYKHPWEESTESRGWKSLLESENHQGETRFPTALHSLLLESSLSLLALAVKSSWSLTSPILWTEGSWTGIHWVGPGSQLKTHNIPGNPRLLSTARAATPWSKPWVWPPREGLMQSWWLWTFLEHSLSESSIMAAGTSSEAVPGDGLPQ